MGAHEEAIGERGPAAVPVRAARLRAADGAREGWRRRVAEGMVEGEEEKPGARGAAGRGRPATTGHWRRHRARTCQWWPLSRPCRYRHQDGSLNLGHKIEN